MSADKQEKATDQRKQKAREQGDVPVSRELTSSAVMLGALFVLRPASTEFVQLWRHGVETSLRSAGSEFATSGEFLRACAMPFAAAFVPVVVVLLTALTGAVVLGAAQTGGVQVHPETIALKMSRINPAARLGQMFGSRAAVRLAKSILPAGVVLWVSTRMLERQMLTEPFLSQARLPSAIAACYHLAFTAGWIAVGWSGLDYVVERRNWAQRLRMSKQDIRDEMRESNGNPQVKGRIRQIQRAMRRRRVRASVQEATVVVTNPTHYAVALAFDTETMAAPKVLAKGRDLIAFAIREEAQWAGVPIVENPPLARSLYRSVEEGEPIPVALYAAVAAILAFLMRRDAQPAAAASAGASGGYGPSPNVASSTVPTGTAEMR